MFSTFLAIAMSAAGAQDTQHLECPLLSEPPAHELRCHIAIDPGSTRDPMPEGEVLVEVTVSTRAELLDTVIISAEPRELGSAAVSSIRLACWGEYRIAGVPHCYRARVPLQFTIDHE